MVVTCYIRTIGVARRMLCKISLLPSRPVSVLRSSNIALRALFSGLGTIRSSKSTYTFSGVGRVRRPPAALSCVAIFWAAWHGHGSPKMALR